MRITTAGIIGGIVGGLGMTAIMLAERKAGAQHPTPARESEDRADRAADRPRHIDTGRATVLEEANHVAASAAFGAGYAAMRSYLPRLPAPGTGAAYGAGLYAANIVAAAPVFERTGNARKVRLRVAATRIGLHLLFGVGTAVITAALHQERERTI
ncbi:hypothetical protein [Stakelama saccharophila]|uniref:DUF1440 domain-containing protein n=1 Tax=Stakelama saccharophila TaxID=3075605 RepID=A0ABZ0B6V8_9SPHN|nr:hypothetical protein [Stakelama sp. W311]WNO53150.1 hypothetical protein RPR59_11930 [Stakelama sp. W311]